MTNPSEPDRPRRSDRLRFRLRDLFLLTLIAAILCAWWIDRSRLDRRVELLELRLARQAQGDESVFDSRIPEPALSPTEFVALVANNDDWNELQDVLVAFRVSPDRSQAVDGLLELAVATDEQVRTRAMSALAQIREQGDVVVPAMIPLLDDPAVNVQWHAANVLGEFAIASPTAVAVLKSKMADDDCPIAAYAAIVVNKLDPSIDIGPRLVELVKNPIRDNRSRAVMSLRHHVGAETARTALTAAFEKEEDEDIRNAIADALNLLES